MINCGVIDRNGNIYELTWHLEISQYNIQIDNWLQLAALVAADCNSLSAEQKNKVLDYALILLDYYNIRTKETIPVAARYKTINKVLKIYSWDFLKSFINKLYLLPRFKSKQFLIFNISSNKVPLKIQEFKKYLLELYNQEFLRVRYGGLYLTPTSNSLPEIYFRIASDNFNWYNIIWKFVYGHQYELSNITITRDDLSVQQCGYYYLNNRIIDHMELEDFIMAGGNPVLDDFREIPKQEYHKIIAPEFKKNR